NTKHMLLYGINPHLAAQSTKDTQLACGRIIIRVREEREAHKAIFQSVVFEDEGVRYGLEHLLGLFAIVFFTLHALGLLVRVGSQLLHARLIFLPLIGGKGTSIDEQRTRHLTFLGLNNVAIGVALFVLAMSAIPPVRMIMLFSIQLVTDHFTHKLRSILGKGRRFRLGCTLTVLTLLPRGGLTDLCGYAAGVLHMRSRWMPHLRRQAKRESSRANEQKGTQTSFRQHTKF